MKFVICTSMTGCWVADFPTKEDAAQAAANTDAHNGNGSPSYTVEAYPRKVNPNWNDNDYADFSFADLRGFYLAYNSLICADLRGADLSGANLTGCILTGADLRGANLAGAILQDTCFENANLQGANLSNSIIKHGNWDYANLKGASFSDAKIYENLEAAEAAK